ncbi:MAG: hypothetical protein AABX34_04065 [Nanoarchaeota archaeon]
MDLEKIKGWIIRNYQDKNEAKVKDLIWLDKKLDNNGKLNWSLVDTVDFDIESIPRKRELIIDVKAKPKVVEQWKKNLLK